MDGYIKTAEILRALGHPARLRIVEILGEEGENCVSHLEHALGIQQANLSQQLARLREAGLIKDRKEGLNVYYSLVDEGTISGIEAIKDLVAELMRESGSLKFQLKRKGTSHSCPCQKCRATKSLRIKLFERLLQLFR